MFSPNFHLLTDLADVLGPSDDFLLLLSCIHAEQFSHLASHFLIAFLILKLPHFNLVVFSLPDQPLVLLLCLDDLITTVFIRLLCLSAIRVDANGVCEPPRIAPVSLDEAACEGAFL